MRILQVIPFFVPAWNYGGPVAVAYNLSKELVKRGHDVTVYTTDALDAGHVIKIREETLDGIKVRRFRNISNRVAFNSRIFISPGMSSSIKDNLKKFEVAHLHEYRTYQNILTHNYANKYNIPYVVQAHGSLTTYFQKGLLKKTFDNIWGKSILNNAAKVLAVTGTEAEQCQGLGLSKEKLDVVPNGIDLTEFANLPSRGQFRSQWNIKPEEKIILFLGRLNQIKGLGLLVEAFALLSKDEKNVKFVIVGSDDGYLPKLKEGIKEFGLEDRVILTGPIHGEVKLKVYADADIYVLPSVYETFPIAMLEASACGLPVIITDRCGLADIVKDHAGLVVPYDKNQLRDALLRLLNDNKLRTLFGNNGKALVHDRFNWTKIAEQVEEIYRGIYRSK